MNVTLYDIGISIITVVSSALYCHFKIQCVSQTKETLSLHSIVAENGAGKMRAIEDSKSVRYNSCTPGCTWPWRAQDSRVQQLQCYVCPRLKLHQYRGVEGFWLEFLRSIFHSQKRSDDFGLCWQELPSFPSAPQHLLSFEKPCTD